MVYTIIGVIGLFFIIGFILSIIAFLVIIKLNDVERVSWIFVDISFAVMVGLGIGSIVYLLAIS